MRGVPVQPTHTPDSLILRETGPNRGASSRTRPHSVLLVLGVLRALGILLVGAVIVVIVLLLSGFGEVQGDAGRLDLQGDGSRLTCSPHMQGLPSSAYRSDYPTWIIPAWMAPHMQGTRKHPQADTNDPTILGDRKDYAKGGHQRGLMPTCLSQRLRSQ